jgi:adenine phosphoribosyltransferase
VHQEDIQPGANVLLIDDVLATGGTAAAAVELVELCGGTVAGLGFVLALEFLNGQSKLPGRSIHALRSIGA